MRFLITSVYAWYDLNSWQNMPESSQWKQWDCTQIEGKKRGYCIEMWCVQKPSDRKI